MPPGAPAELHGPLRRPAGTELLLARREQVALTVVAGGLVALAVAWCVRTHPPTLVAGGSWVVVAGTAPLAVVLARVAARSRPGERTDAVLELVLVTLVAATALLLLAQSATGSPVAVAAAVASLVAVIATFVALASLRVRRRVSFRSLAVDLVDANLVGAVVAAVVLFVAPLEAGDLGNWATVLLALAGYAAFGVAYGHHLLARLTGPEARSWDRTFVTGAVVVGCGLLGSSRSRGVPGPEVWVLVGTVVTVGVVAVARLPRVLPTPLFAADRSEVDRPGWPQVAAGLAVAAVGLRLVVDVGGVVEGGPTVSLDGLRSLCLVLVVLGVLLAVRGRALRAEVDSLAAFVAEETGTDELTGVLTRRAFLRRAPVTLRDAGRLGASAVVVAFDLDDLKATNDAHGHAAGDALLRDFALALRRAQRRQDLVARFGGDEFVALLLLAPDDDPAVAVHHFVRRTTSALGRRREGPIRASWGWSVVEGDVGLVPGLDVADRRMYAMKRLRRGDPAGAEPSVG